MSFHNDEDPRHDNKDHLHNRTPDPTVPDDDPDNPDGDPTHSTFGTPHPDNEIPAAMSPSAEEAYAAVHGYKPSDSPEEAAREMLKEALVPAVNTIVQLSQFSANERIRADNAKLIVEMNLGKIGSRTQPLGDMWDELLKELTGGAGDGNGHKASE